MCFLHHVCFNNQCGIREGGIQNYFEESCTVWHPLASDTHSNSHECAESASTLHHSLPNAPHQLSSSHSNPARKKVNQH